MKTVIINKIEDLENYREQWNGLLTEMNNNNPFITAEWLAYWWDFFGAEKELYIIMSVKDDLIIGFCPLMRIKKRWICEFRFVGYPQSSRMGLIVKPGSEEIFIHNIIEHLRTRKNPSLIRLTGIDREDVCNTLIKKELQGKPLAVKTMPTSYVNIESTDINEYFRSRSLRHHMIKKTLRLEERLSKITNLSISKACNNEIVSIYPVYKKRRDRKTDNNKFHVEAMRNFFTFIAQHNAPSWEVQVFLLKADQMLIGFLYGILCNGRYIAYRIAHDDDFSYCKPGMITFKRVIEKCAQMNISAFDFGYGDEEFKQYWTNGHGSIEHILFGNDSWLAAALTIIYRIIGKAKQALKKSKLLLSFKRAAPGQIKYILSGAPFINLIQKINKGIRHEGFLFLLRAFRKWSIGLLFGVHHRLFKLERPERGTRKSAAFSQRSIPLAELSLMKDSLNIEAETIVRRYIQGSCCKFLYKDGQHAGTLWFSVTGIEIGGKNIWKAAVQGDGCYYDISLFKQIKTNCLTDFFNFLAYRKTGKGSTYILTGNSENRLNRAAGKNHVRILTQYKNILKVSSLRNADIITPGSKSI